MTEKEALEILNKLNEEINGETDGTQSLLFRKNFIIVKEILHGFK